MTLGLSQSFGEALTGKITVRLITLLNLHVNSNTGEVTTSSPRYVMVHSVDS